MKWVVVYADRVAPSNLRTPTAPPCTRGCSLGTSTSNSLLWHARIASESNGFTPPFWIRVNSNTALERDVHAPTQSKGVALTGISQEPAEIHVVQNSLLMRPLNPNSFFGRGSGQWASLDSLVEAELWWLRLECHMRFISAELCNNYWIIDNFLHKLPFSALCWLNLWWTAQLPICRVGWLPGWSNQSSTSVTVDRFTEGVV